LVPVREIGIDALKSRFDKQNNEVLKFKDHTQKLNTLLNVTNTTNIQISTKFDSLKEKQIQLYQQLLTIMRKVEVLRCHGVPLRSSEIEYAAIVYFIYIVV
jgi:hypothetical protein